MPGINCEFLLSSPLKKQKQIEIERSPNTINHHVPAANCGMVTGKAGAASMR